jgi:hypothetical protein
MRILVGAVALLSLAACSTPPAPLGPRVDEPIVGTPMSSAEIRESLVGKTGTGPISGSRITYSMYLAADGTAQARHPGFVDSGRWWLTADNQLCTQWQIYRGGREQCSAVYKEGTSYRLANRQAVELLAFAPGKTF